MSSSNPSPDFRAAVEQAKLEAMKELAYGASHEINNPLANIAGRAQTLLKQEGDPGKRKVLEAIHRQAMRAHEMISDLMLFARPPALEKCEFEIGELLTELVAEVADEATERQIRLTIVDAGRPLRATADRTQIGVALKALLVNSVEAVGQDGEVSIGAAIHAAAADAESLVVTVRDTGPGISPEVREHLFDPFFSGREAGRGLGFGLSKCWRIVTDHGGGVTVESPPASGAVFKVRLPMGG